MLATRSNLSGWANDVMSATRYGSVSPRSLAFAVAYAAISGEQIERAQRARLRTHLQCVSCRSCRQLEEAAQRLLAPPVVDAAQERALTREVPVAEGEVVERRRAVNGRVGRPPA